MTSWELRPLESLSDGLYIRVEGELYIHLILIIVLCRVDYGPLKNALGGRESNISCIGTMEQNLIQLSVCIDSFKATAMVN